MTRDSSDQKATFSFNLVPAEATPMQREITALVNDFEQAASDGDTRELERLRVVIEARLDDFRATRGDGHSHPDWVVPVIEANVYSSFGDLERAVELEREGLAAAHEPRHKSISHMNLSDHLRRLDRPEESLEHAFEANEFWPNEGATLNLALALHRLGKSDAVGKVIEELEKASNLEDETGFLNVALRFEHELSQMTDVPQVKDLLERIHQTQRT